MTAQLILVRHAAVSDRYTGRCYGQSDVELSVEGEHRSRELCSLLTAWPIARVVHSGLQRTRFLGDRLAELAGCAAECSTALQERNFGDWELETWDGLYQRCGDEMTRIVTDPMNYRPGGGETTFELRDRVMAWFHAIPNDDGVIVAVTHGGPIAALCGTQRQLPVIEWLSLIPACGEICPVELLTQSVASV